MHMDLRRILAVSLRSWSGQATQSQLQGSKRVSLLSLLNAPAAAQELLLRHASEFGNKNAFPEEAFAGKNLCRLFSSGLQQRMVSETHGDRRLVCPAT